MSDKRAKAAHIKCSMLQLSLFLLNILLPFNARNIHIESQRNIIRVSILGNEMFTASLLLISTIVQIFCSIQLMFFSFFFYIFRAHFALNFPCIQLLFLSLEFIRNIGSLNNRRFHKKLRSIFHRHHYMGLPC